MSYSSCRLMLALLVILSLSEMGIKLHPAIASSVPPSSTPVVPINSTTNEQSPTKSEDVNQKLLGQWLTKEPIGQEMVMFVFAPDGKAYLVSGQSAQGNALARLIQYRINPATSPLQIDLILGQDEIVQTVFEFSPEGDLRLQMLDTAPGKDRPTTLSERATTFMRISDDTRLPPNTEVQGNSSR